jgi:cytochrome b561
LGTAVWPLSLRFIHWVSAALVLGALGRGVVMVQLVHDPAARFELTQTHKSIGIAVLAITLARLCLRILATACTSRPGSPSPRSLPCISLPRWSTHYCGATAPSRGCG